MKYIATIYVNNTIERALLEINADSEMRARGHAFSAFNEETKYQLNGANVRIDIKEAKREPVTAEEAWEKFRLTGIGATGQWACYREGFKTGEQNRDILYAELMEACKSLATFGTFEQQRLSLIVSEEYCKIKQHQEESCK